MQIIGFDNVKWFYLNNPSATASDCLMTEDGFLWFRYGDQISDSPTLEIEFSQSFDEWKNEMGQFDINYRSVGDCADYQSAYRKLWEGK